jgi:hypothetical protein
LLNWSDSFRELLAGIYRGVVGLVAFAGGVVWFAVVLAVVSLIGLLLYGEVVIIFRSSFGVDLPHPF